MDKNKITFTVIKTAFFVIVAFCLISSIIGLASLYSFKQMAETDIKMYNVGSMVHTEVAEKFSTVASKTIIIVYLVLFLILLNVLHLIKLFIKNEKTVKIINFAVSAICLAALTAVIIVSIIIINQSFNLINELPRFNDYYTDAKSYYDYMYFQSYQGSALSTFIPFIVAAVLCAIVNIAIIVFNSGILNKSLTTDEQYDSADYYDDYRS